MKIVVYFETIKWELQIKPVSECRCDEKLKIKDEESTLLSDTKKLIQAIVVVYLQQNKKGRRPRGKKMSQ